MAPGNRFAKCEAKGNQGDGIKREPDVHVSASVVPCKPEPRSGLVRCNIRPSFPKQFMDDMLVHFNDQEVAVGGKFDDPGRGGLGELSEDP